ncbi:MAG: KUP/HAK/KT family potassium transporter, partial [Deltaproteobacteria bacterium]|nr:KUP/HAK/KT family potassium transporter [Deltaproteobacteria bacterium]
MRQDQPASFGSGVMKSMGVVFGDIGTSPIYTLTVIFLITAPTKANIFGILSLIVWTLIILVTVGYAVLATNLSHKGEGGTIVLREILTRTLKKGRTVSVLTVMSYLGVSLLLGDGVITPAISILSAVEGLTLIPVFEGMGQNSIVAMSIVIAIGLFIFQYKGTDTVARMFGPIMVVWFIALTITGLISIVQRPDVLAAVNPYYAIKFLMDNKIAGFIVLSEVILCATGSEAMYADMGHLGRKSIVNAWYFVFVALVINYLGQGAFLLGHPETKTVLFGMVNTNLNWAYIPFLLLTLTATIIASQAMISGVFSIAYQCINTRIIPMMRVQYTSSHIKSQIYLGFMNWTLMTLVIAAMLHFKASENLAAAYGLAAIGTMTISAILMWAIFFSTRKYLRLALITIVLSADVVFLLACLNKLPHGAYWSLILASIPFISILLWVYGSRALYKSLMPLEIEVFSTAYEQIYDKDKNIPGTALFFTKNWHMVSRHIIHCMVSMNIIYERNIFVSVTRTDEPFGVTSEVKENVCTGLDVLEIKAGYMTVLNTVQILEKHNI